MQNGRFHSFHQLKKQNKDDELLSIPQLRLGIIYSDLLCRILDISDVLNN